MSFLPRPRYHLELRAALLVLMASACLVVAATVSAVEITKLGGSTAFVAEPLRTTADLQQLCVEHRQELAQVLRLADWPGSVEELCSVIAADTVSETSVPSGTSMHWMALRREGALDLLRPVTWAGAEPFAAFQLRVERDDVAYTFVVAKACANLALREAVSTLSISVASGEINLTGADGRPITIRPGQGATVTAPIHGVVRGEGERRPAGVTVEEGTVELHTDGHPVTMTLEAGYSARVVPSAGGQVGFEVPADNPGPVPVRIGDLTGTISRGTSAAAAWPAEKAPPEPTAESTAEPLPLPTCALTTSATMVCVSEPITVNAGGSTDRGKPVQVSLELSGPDGTSEQLAESADAATWSYRPMTPGSYTLTAVATAADGRHSEPCSVAVEARPCPPSCSLSLSMSEVTVGDRLVIDASGSSAGIGQLARVEVEVLSVSGRRLQTLELNEAPFTMTVIPEDRGSFTYRAAAVDELGQRSGETCEASLVVRPRVRNGFSLSLLAGSEHRWYDDPVVETRSSTISGGKLSVSWPLGRTWRLGLAAGTARASEDDLDSSYFAEIETVWQEGRGFLGGGIGVWDLGESDMAAADLLFLAGLDLPWGFTDRSIKLVVEGRLMLDNHIEDNMVLWGGLRIPLW